MRKRTAAEIALSRPTAASPLPTVVVVENVRSAYNVGSILRTADALGVQHVYLAGFTPPGDHPRVHKSALGAQDTVPWTAVADVATLLEDLAAGGHTIVALEQTDAPGSVDALSQDRWPVAIVLGNEVVGVSDAALARCDLALEIPQFGAKHSLNVAVAFGVVGYRLREQFDAQELARRTSGI